jgi:hypothetical protein
VALPLPRDLEFHERADDPETGDFAVRADIGLEHHEQDYGVDDHRLGQQLSFLSVGRGSNSRI